MNTITNETLNFDIESPAEGRIKFPLEGKPFAFIMNQIMDEGGTGRLIR